jgi:hypothetical protein
MASNCPTVRTTRRRLHALGSGVPPLDVDVDALDALDAYLPSLATLLEGRAFAADDEPQVIRITRDGVTEQGIDVGLRLVQDIDDSVVSALTGFIAPADWLAIGVSTGGNAYPIDVGRDAPRRRVRLVHLVSRGGSTASVVRLAGEEPRVLVGGHDHATTFGRVDDVCRRALGLPTAPAGSTLEFWALLWLESIVASGTDDTPSTWEQVAARHLAVRVFAECGSAPGLVAEASASLVRLGVRSANVHGWPELRAECSAGRWPVDGVPATVARWLDDGAFGRWVMGGLPPHDQLLTAACELLSPALGRRVRSVLRAWSVDPPA